MRRYGPSDPMKRVLWRTYARSRTLMVRTPERAVSPSHRTLVYLVAGEGDEPAASLARMVLESGLLGAEWRFGADGGDGVAGDPQGALELIVRSRRARDRGGADLGRFLAQSERFGAGRMLVFAPARSGEWVEPVAAELARLGRSVEVVLGSDGLAASPPGGGFGRRLQQLLLRPAAGERAAAQPAALERVVRRLAAAGAEVTIVDRRSGRRLDRRGRRRRAP